MRFLKVSLLLPVLLLAAGCEGSVPAQSTGDPAGTGGSGSGGQASGGSAGTPPLMGEGSPGRVTFRRLNAREYDNTIRDLVGLDLKPSQTQEFPADEWGDGFDNDGDVLTSSPLLIEKYLDAAQLVVDTALADPTARAKILACDLVAAEATCVASTVSEFARRAFRRPVTTEELAPYIGLVDVAKGKGDTSEVGLKLALAAVLTSPDFLFLVEPDPTPSVVRPLNDFELASRLSYFVWSSMPDETLFQVAGTGTLVQPAEIAKQVTRMLADPKASAFSGVLARQWMQTVALDVAEPNLTIFPMWKETLKPAMEQELIAFLGPIVSGTAPVSDMISASYTYANRELAEFYGLPNAAALPVDTFQRVDLDVTRRGGVLRQGSFLVLTSHPDRNSPTKRGKWILDRILCSPPPPPPADVPALDPNVPFQGTLRQRMETLHQEAGAACAGCHAVIDPMGFALENYDAVGLWREMDNGYPIDATGTMPITAEPFNGAAELTTRIAADPRFPACVAKQILTFALGRHTTADDKALIDRLGTDFSSAGSLMPKLVELVAQSPAMTSRATEAP